MREVAARDEYDAAAELFCRLCDLLAEPVVDISAEAREADTHDLDQLFELRLQEVERDHRAVVERRLPLAEEAGREIVCRTGIRQCLREDIVVLRLYLDLRATERREIPHSLLARRDVEVIAIHRRVRTRDDDHIRLQRRRTAHDLAISRRRPRNLLLLTPADLRQDEGRMWHRHSSHDCHKNPSF